jgi:hypothetical protein
MKTLPHPIVQSTNIRPISIEDKHLFDFVDLTRRFIVV